MYEHMCAHIQASRMCVHIYVCMYVCMYMYIYLSIYLYLFTYFFFPYISSISSFLSLSYYFEGVGGSLLHAAHHAASPPQHSVSVVVLSHSFIVWDQSVSYEYNYNVFTMIDYILKFRNFRNWDNGLILFSPAYCIIFGRSESQWYRVSSSQCRSDT